MVMTREKISYGMTDEVFATRKGDGDTIVVGGVGHQSNRWARVLTRRAAHKLWFVLTKHLFPEKFEQVTGMAQTAPLRSAELPTITTHLEVRYNAKLNTIDVMGQVGEDRWYFRVDANTARKLWAALDTALYPAGWQGPTTKHLKLN